MRAQKRQSDDSHNRKKTLMSQNKSHEPISSKISVGFLQGIMGYILVEHNAKDLYNSVSSSFIKQMIEQNLDPHSSYKLHPKDPSANLFQEMYFSLRGDQVVLIGSLIEKGLDYTNGEKRKACQMLGIAWLPFLEQFMENLEGKNEIDKKAVCSKKFDFTERQNYNLN
jgi:hypothetical protein